MPSCRLVLLPEDMSVRVVYKNFPPKQPPRTKHSTTQAGVPSPCPYQSPSSRASSPHWCQSARRSRPRPRGADVGLVPILYVSHEVCPQGTITLVMAMQKRAHGSPAAIAGCQTADTHAHTMSGHRLTPVYRAVHGRTDSSPPHWHRTLTLTQDTDTITAYTDTGLSSPDQHTSSGGREGALSALPPRLPTTTERFRLNRD